METAFTKNSSKKKISKKQYVSGYHAEKTNNSGIKKDHVKSQTVMENQIILTGCNQFKLYKRLTLKKIRKLED